MREHPIPQDITGYKFHIIGSMTLKQFAEVAIGAVIGIIFYSTNLPAVIKWPFIILFVGLGVVAAFVPINQRPLDRWIMIFISVLFKPTQYYWRRISSIPSVFTYDVTKKEESEVEVDYTPLRRQKIREYMDSMKTATTIEPEPMDVQEASRLDEIMQAFGTQQSLEPVHAEKLDEKPQLEVRMRSLSNSELEQLPEVVKEHNLTELITETEKPISSEPVEIFIGSNKQDTDQIIQNAPTNTSQSVTIFPENHNQILPNNIPTVATVFNTNLPFPSKPKVANQIVGMVLDKNDTILTDVVVKVLNENDTVERAVSTNALGQFSITTPLSNGSYILQFEKGGYQFQKMELSLEGQIVEPLEIRTL